MRRLVLVNCSNPLPDWARPHLSNVGSALEQLGYDFDSERVLQIYESSLDANQQLRWPPETRADLLNEAFRDPDVAAVLDVSGGDVANEILPLLDWRAIANHSACYAGFSDNSCIVNAVVAKTGRQSLLWNVVNGLWRGFSAIDDAVSGRVLRPELLGPSHVADLPWIGGNMRCFLKLAGTEYWPELEGRALLIEALSADLASLSACLAQHEQLGSFGKLAGVVVGQLTAIDNVGERETALRVIAEYAGGIPVAQAPGVGHSPGNEPVTIG